MSLYVLLGQFKGIYYFHSRKQGGEVLCYCLSCLEMEVIETIMEQLPELTTWDTCIYIYTVGESVGPGLMASEILKSGPESSLCGGLLRVLNNPEK